MHAPKQFVTDLSSLGGLPVLLVVMAAVPENAWRMVFAFAITLIVTVAARLVWPRERPEKREAKNMLERIDAASFPSLHTARAAISGLAIVSAPWTYAISAIIITAVAAARMKLKAHDLLDVSAGAILGIAAWFAAPMVMFL